jgi:predicted AlkP superfamily phosphohydrolase/phosphomutase
MFSRSLKKALIVGIDGVPHSLLRTYLDHGLMPNLREILKGGHLLHPMNASIPDISSVSWTSFATGVNPGEHGIYGFTDLRPHSYSLYFPNSKDRKAPTFWELLGKTADTTSSLSQQYLSKIDRPYRSIVLNMPHTYPAYPMNGILVAGFVAIDLKKATYPDSAFAYLNQMGYLIDVDAEKAKESKQALMQEIWNCFEKRKEAILHFFRKESWDLFCACVTETDRLHHFFFDASGDTHHPFHQAFLNFYEELDKFIKTLYDEFNRASRGKGFFMILSDHGFAPIRREVYMNAFLREKEFLALNDTGDFYERISDQTRAFDLDPCRIYIHGGEAFPRGKVKKEERAQVLKEIEEALRTLRGEDGEQVIDRIFRREEIYRGPYVGRAPDLVCLPKDGYDLKGSLEKKEIFSRNLFTGMHTWHDAFCILPSSAKIAGKPSVEEMAGYILGYFTQTIKTNDTNDSE